MTVARIDLVHDPSEERQKRKRRSKTAPLVIAVIALAAATANRIPEGRVNPPDALVTPPGTQGVRSLLPVASARCNEEVSGGNTADTRIVNLGKSSGTFLFSDQTFAVPDRIVVSYEGRVRVDTGCGSVFDRRSIAYAGTDTYVTVEVTPNCSGTPSTRWNYTVGCAE